MTDLAPIFAGMSRAFTAADFLALHAAGVPSDLVFQARRNGDIGAAEITRSGGQWRPKDGGERAYVLPVDDQNGEIVDLIAFRTETPRSFWTMTGEGKLLGKAALDEATHYGAPLMVFDGPLEWLRARGEGIVVLDWQQYWPLWFGGVPALRCHSVEFAKRLKATLERPFQIPEIQVSA